MEFIESHLFSRQVQDALADDDYRALQEYLVARPDAGVLVSGGGGLRKLRWAGSGRGKRGGSRVIYYWSLARDSIVLFYLYSKNRQSDLTQQQIAVLRRLIKED